MLLKMSRLPEILDWLGMQDHMISLTRRSSRLVYTSTQFGILRPAVIKKLLPSPDTDILDSPSVPMKLCSFKDTKSRLTNTCYGWCFPFSMFAEGSCSLGILARVKFTGVNCHVIVLQSGVRYTCPIHSWW